jgi:PAS domain S-box-containing protein
MTKSNAQLPDRDNTLWPIGFGLYAVAGGSISLAGWAADVPWLADWDFNGITIQPNAAAAAVVAGAGLILLAYGYGRAAFVAGALTAFIGAGVIFQYATGIDLGIDTLLMFDRTWGRLGTLSPGRMGPAGAVSWTLIGLSLLLAGTFRPPALRLRTIAAVLPMVTALIGSLSIIGHLYGADELFTIPTVTVIALQTSTFILAISIGLVLAIPDRGLVRVARGGPAAVLIKRGLPLMIILPIVLGYLRLVGGDAGLFDVAFGTALRTIVEIALMLGVLWWTAGAVNAQARRRSQVEHELHASHQRVTDTLESIVDGFITLDRDSRFTYINAEAERLLGVNRTALLGKVVWETFPEAAGSLAHKQLRLAIDKQIGVEFEDFNPIMRRWFANRAHPTPDGGVAVYFQDITWRKKTEEALRRSQRELEIELSDNQLLQRVSAETINEDDPQMLYEKLIGAAVVVMRSQFASLQMLDADRGTLRLLASYGFDPAAEELSNSIEADARSTSAIALRTESRVIVPDILKQAPLVGAELMETYVRSGIRAIQSTPLISRTGKILGMISTHWSQPHEPSVRDLRLLDILARQAADLIERRANEQALLDASRRKDSFLATLAHELRNPLAPIRSAIDLIKVKPADSVEVTWAHDVIDRHVHAMSRLVDDLLDVSRIATDKMDLRRERLDLHKPIEAAVELCRPLIDRAQHWLIVDVPPDPVFVHADPIRLGQVFGNLLHNACKYTKPRGEIRVTVRCDAPTVHISIRDNGIGIAADRLHNVFDLFSQYGPQRETADTGLGIGLYLVKRLVQMHGGTIEARSDGPDRGSEFLVSLPVAAGLPLESSAASSDESDEHIASVRRILVVDDNVDAASSLGMLLAPICSDIHLAYDGAEAVESADTLRPDVILMDIGLPKFNGFEACRQIRQRPWAKAVVMIAITGWGQDGDRRKSTEAGFDFHLVKPVQRSALVKLLGSALSNTAG